MKNALPLISLAFLAFLLPVYGQGTQTGALSPYNLRISPDPVTAGSNMTVSFQIYDSYSSSLSNVNLELEGAYPILNISPTHSNLITTMSQGIYGGSTTYFTYNVKIPQDTVSGEYNLTLVAYYQTTVTTVTGISEIVTGESTIPISFYVHGIPKISIVSTPSHISPGEEFPIVLDVSNIGYGTAKGLNLSLISDANFTALGSSSFSIGNLAPHGTVSINAEYQASPALGNGTYRLPMHVSYTPEVGPVQNALIYQNLSIAVDNPDIVVSAAGAFPQALYQGYNQSVTLSIANIGYGTAKNVSVGVLPGPGTSVLGSVNNFFIGSIAPGQSVQEALLVSANNGGSYNSSLLARVDYYPANYGSSISKNETVSLSVVPSSSFTISNGEYLLPQGSPNAQLRLRITNTGNIAAKNLQLSFQSQYPITPVTSSYYLADLEPGQTANVTFQVSVDEKAQSGRYPVTIYENWKQSNGAPQQVYYGTSNYYAIVGSQQGTGGIISYIIYLAVIIIAAYIVAAKRRQIGRLLRKRGSK